MCPVHFYDDVLLVVLAVVGEQLLTGDGAGPEDLEQELIEISLGKYILY